MPSIFGFLAPKDCKIIWLSSLLALSVHDESYSRNASCAINVISVILYQRLAIITDLIAGICTALVFLFYNTYIFPALVLSEQVNCLDLKIICYILSLTEI